MTDKNNTRIKKLIRLAAFAASMLIFAFNFTDEMRLRRSLGGAVFIKSSTVSEEAAAMLKRSTGGANGENAAEVSGSMDESLGMSYFTLSLFNVLKLSGTRVYTAERTELLPCGDAIGISVHTDGVLIVGFGSIRGSGAASSCPAKTCGLKEGDVIKSVNGNVVCTSNELQLALRASSGAARIGVERQGKKLSFEVEPVKDAQGTARIGAWVRDSTIGIGTLSFISVKNGRMAALGHAVVDNDTSVMLPVLNGNMVLADILGVVRGQQGKPGELKGTFSSKSERLGSVDSNGFFGIGGSIDEASEAAARFLLQSSLPLAFPDEVHTGDAYILSQTDAGSPRAFKCRIIRTVKQKSPEQKGLVIEITDEALLDATGGIVQGMSGSPIIQDGRLAGVVTHVFINDPTKGYGVYAFWMYEGMSK